MPVRFVYRPRTVSERHIASLSCNVCGKTEPQAESKFPPPNMHIIKVSGGYGTDFPVDCTTITIVLCSACLKGWTETFTLPVDTKSDFGGDPPHVLESETKEVLLWDGGRLLREGEIYTSPDEDPNTVWSLMPSQGVYRHYKGGIYEVLGHAWDAQGTPYVVYRALHSESQVWARPVRSWVESVVENGESVPRFASY